MKKKTFLLLFAASLFAGLTSCEEKTICDLSTNAPLRVGFYSMLNDSVEIDTLTGSFSAIGIGVADTLIAGLTDQRKVQLTLNPLEDKTGYLLIFDGVHDTLEINSERELQLVSEQCGFMTNFTIRNVTTTYNHIDSVAVINSDVNTENEEHVKIYF